MLNNVRIAELLKILSNLNISANGRKIDLQRRILKLLPENYDILSHKIRETYTQFV